ncbi:hypothetical protein H5410_060461 [Solanum commersonii]|uniref:Uncharacterized protein n=1 Tax=Solanum commersonii TaxID=4109 RepID=A0A9J5W5Q0_SOLCO|nr:hypothetical protein H5410_060461 [Solanum commersonii]
MKGKKLIFIRSIPNLEIRAQIIDKISNTSTSQNHIREDVPTKEGSYTKAEVKNLQLERRKLISFPTTISDIKQEINNLKVDIHRLKEKNVTIEIRLDNIKSLKDLGNSSESSSYEGDSKDLDFLKTLHFGHPMYKEFLDFIQSKQGKDNIPQSYSTVLTDEENIEIFDQNDKKKVILLLEQSDLRWKNDPWQIMQMCLYSVSYTTFAYKYKMYYEMILSAAGSGEF